MIMIAIIAAVAKNNVIGKKNDLPWYLPEDLKRFKELTTGHTVIMGRRTYESIITRLGKPLPNRKNIVITRNSNYQAPEGVVVVQSFNEALAAAGDDDAFIIGGEQIFKDAICKADTMYLTEIHRDYDGDVYFPEMFYDKWNRGVELDTPEYAFVIYRRKTT